MSFNAPVILLDLDILMLVLFILHKWALSVIWFRAAHNINRATEIHSNGTTSLESVQVELMYSFELYDGV